jgi:hypothetical protein
VQGHYITPGYYYDGGVYHGKGDGFVARLSPDGTALEYATYLGGENREMGQAIAVDSDSRAYVAGVTASYEFPTLNPFASTARVLNNGSGKGLHTDGFISVLSSNGNALAYSSYLGGDLDDAALAITLDALTNAYVTGYAFSTNFPRTATNFTAWASRTNANSDVFVTRLNSVGGTNGGYSILFGGKSNDQGISLAVDGASQAYVVGLTASRTNFADLDILASLPPGFSATNSTLKKYGTQDAFLVALDPGGSNLFSAYLGGVAKDQANAITFDTNANAAYVVGTTSSTNFPGALPLTYHGKRAHSEAVISRIVFP